MVVFNVGDRPSYTLEELREAIVMCPPPIPGEAVDEATPSDMGGFELPAKIAPGDRHMTMHRYVRSQKAKGVPFDEAADNVRKANAELCKPPLKKDELEGQIKRSWNEENAPGFTEKDVYRAKKLAESAAKGFVLTAKGDSISAKSQHNIRLAVAALDAKLNFDLFSQKPIIKYNGYHGPYMDEQRNRLWLTIDEKLHFQPADGFFDVVTQDMARRSPFHPVRDYLNQLQWDGIPRLDEWLIAYGGAGDSPYTRAVSAIVLIAAVRRVFKPGCKFDEILVLESEQGLNKSSALRALCVNDDWFSDDLPLNVDAKQIIERTAGKWIIEAGELSGMHSSKVEHLKAMLSRQVDGPVRMAYARLPVEVPRQFIIVGTTNAHSYLEDQTGNRRFWPVRCEDFKVPELCRDRDQIWAEAVVRERAGESIRLSPDLYPQAAKQQDRRRTADPWEDIIERAFGEEYQRLTSMDIWQCLGIASDRQDSRAAKRVATAMQRLGFRKQAVRDDKDKVVKGWARGKRLTNDGELDQRTANTPGAVQSTTAEEVLEDMGPPPDDIL